MSYSQGDSDRVAAMVAELLNRKKRTMLRSKLLLPSLVLMTLLGCARRPQVESPLLPVQRVVIYRNGVAYFEREGVVDSDVVEFKLREENVGDFLATLAVLEGGGDSVRAASFPVSIDSDDEGESDGDLESSLNRWDRKKVDPRALRRVTLELDGKHERIKVGYLAETPLWRPSYRLIVGENGAAELQAWGIVQNQSGEDWVDVKIALVAGAPIAYESTLGEVVIPRRPKVTDEGEVIASVPEGLTTLHQRPEVEADDEMSDSGYALREESYTNKAVAKSASRPRASAGMPAEMSAEPAPSEDGPREKKKSVREAAGSGSRKELAQVTPQTGATRYEVSETVTIPDKSATMVLLVAKKVPGEAVFLYSPDGGVPDSQYHPFRVVRFKNESGGMLERGPIAVFEKGAFLGQGIVESLPPHARSTVPFALMRTLSIEQKRTYNQRGARLYSIRDGNLTIERDHAVLTEYQINNGEAKSVKLLVRHDVQSGSKLWEPPQGTELLSAESAALVPVQAGSFGRTSLTVEERRPVQGRVGFQSAEGLSALRDYLVGKNVPSGVKPILQKIVEVATQLSSIQDGEKGLVRERQEHEKNIREIRLSMRAIAENKKASQLRGELTKRLSEVSRRLDAITKNLVELQLNRTELEIRLKQLKRGLVVSPPDRR